MSYIDYGAIAKKNRKLLGKNNEFFQEMKELVGFEIDKIEDKKIKGKYFSYLGDKDLLICLYKNGINIFDVNKKKLIYEMWGLRDENNKDIFHKNIIIKGVNINIKRIGNCDIFKLRVWYKNQLWEAIYGYGVAFNIHYIYAIDKKVKKYIKDWLFK